jgi:hypothetical protein
VKVGHGHVSTGLGQSQNDRATDPPCTAAYERAPALERPRRIVHLKSSIQELLIPRPNFLNRWAGSAKLSRIAITLGTMFPAQRAVDYAAATEAVAPAPSAMRHGATIEQRQACVALFNADRSEKFREFPKRLVQSSQRGILPTLTRLATRRDGLSPRSQSELRSILPS